MAGVAPADALHAGTDEPNPVGRDAAEEARHAGTSHTKDSASSSPSLQAHDEGRDADVDDTSVASSSADDKHSAVQQQGRATGTNRVARHQQQDHQQQLHQQQLHQQQLHQHHHYSPLQVQQHHRPLRKSASASTTDTTASAQTNASTEVRAAVSNRASRAALNQRNKSIASSPTIPQEFEHEFDHPPSSFYTQDTGLPYRQGTVASSLLSPPSTFDPSRDPGHAGIVQVNPAPPPSPPPQHRGRNAMASSFLPAIFGRRRPTSSASTMTASSNFAAHNPPPPGPQAFDFNAILSSLEADDAARADIDAIAEICGHSRLSLANAHANHRDPVGELVGIPAPSSQLAGSRGAGGLEPVAELLTPRREEEAKLGSPSNGQTGDDGWPMGGSTERGGDDRGVARQAARGISGVAYGRSASTEEEGRARRHLARVREVSGERDQRRWRRSETQRNS